MNIKTADRLCTLRKEHNLSQEELAEKLGVSRQAVSKWERSEASPDTDNLIELAHIYGISLDELINGDEAIELIKESKVEEEEEIKPDYRYEDDGYVVTIYGDEAILDDGVETRKYSIKEHRAKKNRIHTVKGIVDSIFVLLAVATFLIAGFLTNQWVNFYFVFILIPVAASIVEAIYRRSMKAFAYPVLVAAVYCAISQPTGLWHPLWIVFLTIPVYYAIANPVDKNRKTDDFEVIDDALDEMRSKKK